MLYALLYPLRSRFPAFNVFRYITFRTAMAAVTALVVSLLLGPACDPEAEIVAAEAIRAQGGAGVALQEGRHADDGRAAHSRRRSSSPRSSGWTSESATSGSRVATTAALGGDRIPRRLDEGSAKAQPRPLGTRRSSVWQFAVDPGGGSRDPALAAGVHALDDPDVSVSEECPPRSRDPLRSRSCPSSSSGRPTPSI